jgi:hypothetical protein
MSIFTMKIKNTKCWLLSLVFVLCQFSVASQADTNGGGIVVPSVLVLKINEEVPGGAYYNSSLGPSQLHTQTFLSGWNADSKPSQDFKILGGIYTNCTGLICNGSNAVIAQIFPINLSLYNGTSEIKVTLHGQIGGRAISLGVQPITLNRTNLITVLPWQANIEIIGDIDESSFSLLDRPGTYGGSFTIVITRI